VGVALPKHLRNHVIGHAARTQPSCKCVPQFVQREIRELMASSKVSFFSRIARIVRPYMSGLRCGNATEARTLSRLSE
ncbi:MAG TPA: hypothetical protein VNH83_27225, partial [Bryobacteraceae bacterium]|nr:hypothetical protein [Bryobacteraceae bacterium]